MVHGILQSHAPGCPVEKASYDDFYLDVTSLCHMDMGAADTPPPHLHITHAGQWPDVRADMRNALMVGILLLRLPTSFERHALERSICLSV